MNMSAKLAATPEQKSSTDKKRYRRRIDRSERKTAADTLLQLSGSGAGTIFQQGGQAWCVTQPFQVGGVGGAVSHPSGVRGRTPEANASWQQLFEN